MDYPDGVSAATVGVYVHVPFCERVCPYCDFAVVGVRTLTAEVERRYVDALLRELELRRPAFAGRELASLYLGGGTPSLCRPESLARIVRAARAAFEVRGPVEVTLEANPSTLERERLPGFRDAGVNRLSLGIQSFDDATLKRLGRAHRGDEARLTLQAARTAGFEALSCDLIFAAPDQGLPQLEADIDELLAFAPEHVSAYELNVEPGTPFATAAERGQLACAGEDEALAMWDAIESRLEAAAYVHYELSAYARPGFEAVHNQRYWRRQPVLGLGVGAFSTDPRGSRGDAPFGLRRSNLRSPDAYLARIEAGESAESEPAEALSPETARAEAMFLSLRTRSGLDAAAFEREFGRPPRGFYPDEITTLVAQALLAEDSAGGLRLTRRGQRLSDTVFANFVELGD
ncbi:MAG: radical SAM family heme chaperone HemW [Deltaproteobacteria bacterium]|nr:radical SAM family heme chaperone HemW [Deltaproteobacteria bacterium]